MKLQLIPSSLGPGPSYHVASTIVVNDVVALDAGTIGMISPLDDQRRLRHVLISHSHQDHIATLPMFLDNVYDPRREPVTIHASLETLEALFAHQFNEVVWPDLVRLSQKEAPFLATNVLPVGVPLQLGDLEITPIPLRHVVPTFGFLLDDGDSSVAIISDTAPTETIWQLAAAKSNLRAVWIEASFPNEMQWLADRSHHLTPHDLAAEYTKLGRDVPVYVLHIKSAYFDVIVRELRALGLPRLEIVQPGRSYVF